MSLDDVSHAGHAPVLSLRGVAVWRWHAATATRVRILETLDWDVYPGERWALLGPNGAGKTTVLTVAAAVEFPSAGTVTVLGGMLGGTEVHRLRERIGFVDARAGYRFATGLSVTQVVRTGATQTIGFFAERLTDADSVRAEELVHRLGLAPLAKRRFADCSQGERKRALIARALVPRPRLLLLDEPAAGLDLTGRELLLATLDLLVREEPALAVVTTTHHLEELPATTSHGLLLRAGRVVAAGPADRVLTAATLTDCFGLEVEVARAHGRWNVAARR
ncbi:MAG: ABC transporter ATP-binding protein [Gaiella sp.]